MNERYEYKFERIGGRHMSPRVCSAACRETIVARGSEGWRFVQMLALDVRFLGASRHFELIFERRVS